MAAIDAAFADPEPLIYLVAGASVSLAPFQAIRTDGEATFGGGVSSPRTSYEINPTYVAQPKRGDNFEHRGRRWKVEEANWLPAINRWDVRVSDAGPLA
ncbi:head-tail joining protein [Sphingomonas sp. Xoc002]|uniref:head-tail joining protein n=1 Tax=Sphingomonas sp. Xoc002 TaxID=2837624 RepID=UPI003D167FE7